MHNFFEFENVFQDFESLGDVSMSNNVNRPLPLYPVPKDVFSGEPSNSVIALQCS